MRSGDPENAHQGGYYVEGVRHARSRGLILAWPGYGSWAVNGEFGNMCAMSLAAGKDTQTDCSINAQLEGKTYCFGDQAAMTEFMKAPKENLAKAQSYYSSKHPG
jgi:YHS domain-containing protein